MVANPLYYQEEDNGVYSCRGARAVDGQAEYLEDKILGRCFGLESGVTTEGWTSLFFYYDHIHSIIRNTQLPYMLHC